MISEAHTDPFILGAINAWGDVFSKTVHDDQAQHPQEWRAYKTWRYVPDIGLLMWWESPDEGEKMTVEDWLERKGYEIRIRSVMGQKLRVREVVKSLKGTPIKRYKNLVGKRVGPQLYVHRKYASEIIPVDTLKRAAETLKQIKPGFRFNSVMWNQETGEVRFDEAPDFDTAREPHVGKYITVYPNGSTREGQSNNIWHHKWLWVKDDYQGFDVDKAREWSTMWLSKLPQIAKGTDKSFAGQLQTVGLSETTNERVILGVIYRDGEINSLESNKTNSHPPEMFRGKRWRYVLETKRLICWEPLDEKELWAVKEHLTSKGYEVDRVFMESQRKISETKIHGHDFPMIVYHGGGMEKKKPVIFLTRHLNVAKSYADDRNWGDRSGGKVHKFELTIRNPAGNDAVDKVGKALGIEGLNHPDESSHEYLSPEMVGHENVQRMVDELKKLGYDSAWVDGDFSMDSDFTEYDSFIIWDGSQLKPLGLVDQNIEGTIKLKELLMNEASQDEAALDFLKKMVQSGPFKGNVYLAGGAVRDMVMGKVPKDLDVVVTGFGEKGGMAFATWLAQQMGNYKAGSNPVLFPTFGTAKVVLAGEHNGVNLDGFDVEAVFARKETYTPGSRKPQVSPGTIEDDAFRRDFTVNSMMLDLTTGNIFDITGKGKSDIKTGVIRTTSDPDEIFGQDALRMFRAIRFATKYNWQIDPKTIEGIKNNLNNLGNTSKERVRDELDKILQTSNPRRGFELLRDTGLLSHIAPELQQAVGMTQNVHHNEDVFGHTLSVLQATKPDLVTRLMALFHDIGKVATRSETPTGVHFYAHEEEGEKVAERIMRDLKYPLELIQAVKAGVRNHMRLKQGGDDAVKLSDKTLRKFKIELGDNLEKILDVIHADNTAHAGPSAMPNQIENVRKRLQNLAVTVKKPTLPINGDDLQKMGVRQGPEIGKILSAITEKWFENPEITREEALAIAQSMMGRV